MKFCKYSPGCVNMALDLRESHYPHGYKEKSTVDNYQQDSGKKVSKVWLDTNSRFHFECSSVLPFTNYGSAAGLLNNNFICIVFIKVLIIYDLLDIKKMFKSNLLAAWILSQINFKMELPKSSFMLWVSLYLL